ncbi:reverse transcriptase domain-containing protein [Tanacetum coccineum]
MTTPVEKRNANKFFEFHGEVGHNTDECNHLRRQIEDILKAGKLDRQKKKGETSGKEKPQAILMIQPWQKDDEGAEGPLIIEAEIEGHQIESEEKGRRAEGSGGGAGDWSTKRCKPLKSDKLGNIPKEISGLQRDAIPMVANRKFTVLRTCLKIDQGTWVIAELSHVSAPYTYRRLPSGCLIECITETVSKVTWVEHMEVDEPLPNRSGFAFGAERMVAWLERSCERWSHMNATCHIKDPQGKGVDSTLQSAMFII